MSVFGIIMIVYVGLLWLLILSNKIDQWPPLAGRIAGFSLLVVALFFQFVWFALVIEGWQLYWVAVPTDPMKQQPVLEAIQWLLQLGKKTGWLLVGFTALIVFARVRHNPPMSRWLMHAVGWISTIALIGVLGEMHLLLALYPLLNPIIAGSQLLLPDCVLHIGLCLLLYGILLWLLTTRSSRFALQTVALLLVGSVVIGCSSAKNEPIVPVALVKPTETATPLATDAPVILPTPISPPALPATPTDAPPVEGARFTTLPAYENVLLPDTLYFLSIEGQIWSVDKETRRHQQITHEAHPILDYDYSASHGHFVFVSDNQLIEFDPATNQRVVKLATLSESELWTINENGDRICIQCDQELVLSPRYSPDGSQIAYAKGGINLIESGLEQSTSPRQLQTNVRFQVDTEDINATRFYDDSLWSPDGTRIAFHARAWEWAGYEIYDLKQNRLQIVRSPTVPGVHLCCQWQWGMDSANGYIAAPISHGPVEDSGLYRINVTDASVLQINSGKNSGDLVGQQRGVIGVHPSASGELFAFISVNDDKWVTQPTLYMLHRIDPNGGEPTAVNERQTLIEGEVLWALDGSGALVMTASFSPPGAAAVGKFVWMRNSTEYSYPQPLTLIGSHLRWGGASPAGQKRQSYYSPTEEIA